VSGLGPVVVLGLLVGVALVVLVVWGVIALVGAPP
jgi:hypothetical protein